jgi:hypothetical protein
MCGHIGAWHRIVSPETAQLSRRVSDGGHVETAVITAVGVRALLDIVDEALVVEKLARGVEAEVARQAVGAV